MAADGAARPLSPYLSSEPVKDRSATQMSDVDVGESTRHCWQLCSEGGPLTVRPHRTITEGSSHTSPLFSSPKTTTRQSNRASTRISGSHVDQHPRFPASLDCQTWTQTLRQGASTRSPHQLLRPCRPPRAPQTLNIVVIVLGLIPSLTKMGVPRSTLIPQGGFPRATAVGGHHMGAKLPLHSSPIVQTLRPPQSTSTTPRMFHPARLVPPIPPLSSKPAPMCPSTRLCPTSTPEFRRR